MKLTATNVRWIAAGCLVLAAACSSSDDEAGTANSLLAVTQDLGVDPAGTTTVVDFQDATSVELVQTGHLTASGGQSALTIAGSGSRRTVTWDAIVSPAHSVSVTGLSLIDPSPVGVTTSDSSVPTFAITSATQTPGLGGDAIQVQFSGPRVVTTEAEDPTRWILRVNGIALDLSGSVFSLDPATQLLDVTTGSMANLHASFTLAASNLHSVAAVSLASAPVLGAAGGDVTAPGLVSAAQNLAQDEYGRVIDFTFDEAMDPVFALALGNFAPGLPDFALIATQPAEDTLRVRFNNPLVPGVNTVQLANVVDAHGNALPTQTTPLTAGSTVANGFSTAPELTTVANVGGDTLAAVLVQAIDIDDAPDATHWLLESPVGTPIALGGATLDYDLIAKTVTITLTQDLTTGDSFRFAAQAGDPPLDVDGEPFLGSFTGTVGGDLVPPAVIPGGVVQNRNVDGTGKTLDVTFGEDVDLITAQNPANWSVAGATVQSATLLAGLDTVRVVFDQLVVPGTDTLGVSGVQDLAGITMAPAAGLAITSTDLDAPEMQSALASAVAGSDDDSLVVVFDDDMLAAEVVVPGSWALESPVGTPLDLSAATFDYDEPLRTATVTFGAATGIDLKRDDDFQIALSTMRDIAGNAVSATPAGGVVQAETVHPLIDSVWVETAFPNQVHVRFSEPCDHLDDLAGGTSYAVYDGGGVFKGTPSIATPDADEIGVELVFGFVVVPGVDTLDVSGVSDLAGNALFPRFDLAVEPEDAGPLDLVPGASVVEVISGEDNDRVQIELDRRPSLWKLTDPASWSVVGPSGPVSLAGASITFDGTTTVTIDLDAVGAPSLTTGVNYDLQFTGLMSAQGVAPPGPPLDTILSTGDVSAPLLAPGQVRLWAQSSSDNVLVEWDEAVDPGDALNPALYALNGALAPDTTFLVGKRTVRAVFSGGVTAGDTLDVTLSDPAGNAALQSQAVTAQDVAGPLVVSVSAQSVPNVGGDLVRVVYNKPIDPLTGFDLSHYSIDNGAGPVSLAGAQVRYECATNTLTIHLAPGVELDPLGSLTVDVADVEDHAGLVMNPPASVGGAVTGDLVAPSLVEGFVNWRVDPLGRVVELRFDEHMEPASVGALSWSASGGPTVMGLEDRGDAVYRVTLDQPLGVGETLTVLGASDVAGNVAGPLVLIPTH